MGKNTDLTGLNINVIFTDIDSLADNDLERFLKCIPGSMRNELSRYRHLDTLKAKLLARLILSDQLHCSGSEYTLRDWRLSQTNKPFILNWDHFNFSHSGKMVIFCRATIPVGVDVELIEDFDYLSVAAYFRKEEIQCINRAADPLRKFFEIWVKKEALSKALGIGLGMSLAAVDCQYEEVLFENSTYFFHPISLHPSYISYLCTSVKDMTAVPEYFEVGSINRVTTQFFT